MINSLLKFQKILRFVHRYRVDTKDILTITAKLEVI